MVSGHDELIVRTWKMSSKAKHYSSDGKHRGKMTVAADEVRPGKQETVYFVVNGGNLDRKDLFGKCDPFLKISRINYDDT